MYDEIIRAIMSSKMFDVIFCFSIALLGFVIYFVFFDIPFKKKKMSKKKRNRKKKEVREAFWGAVAVAVAFFLVGCINLGEYLTLQGDMVSENYATYTGEFRYYKSHSTKGVSSKHLQWVDENGKTITIEYTGKIEQFQPNGASLSEGNYKGTIVYASKSEYLLWWDAEPIED